MPAIGFLLPETHVEVGHENHELMSAAFERAGWTTHACITDTLCLTDGSVYARDGERAVNLFELDACWLMGFGRRESFLDKVQLLKLVEAATPLVNSVDAYVFLHGKILLSALPSEVSTPETHLSNDADWIVERVCRDGGKWVLKTPAGSFGRDVFLVTRDDTNLRPIVARLTGHTERDYCLLQRYLEEASEEKRILLAGDRVVGQYRRVPGPDHRGNLNMGGHGVACSLSTDDQRLITALEPFLKRWGVSYCALDVAGKWLLEINVANPGGLGSLKRLGATAPEDSAVEGLIGRLAS